MGELRCRLNLFNMTTGTVRQTVVIDATNEVPGRLATKIAQLLMGKNKADYTPHIDSGAVVEVRHASNMRMSLKKLEDKIYYKHTGHPGHLRETKQKEVFEKDPTDVLRRAVKNMLPNNKLHNLRMKRLIISK